MTVPKLIQSEMEVTMALGVFLFSDLVWFAEAAFCELEKPGDHSYQKWLRARRGARRIPRSVGAGPPGEKLTGNGMAGFSLEMA